MTLIIFYLFITFVIIIAIEEELGDCSHIEDRLTAIERILGVNSDFVKRDTSLLEQLWQEASESIYRMTPPTDEECTFNYATGKCNPKCRCEMTWKFGDYSPSRACRIRTELPNETCDANADDPHVLAAAFNGAKGVVHGAIEYLRDHAPATDEECKFSIAKRRCVPESICTFEYQLGDFSLDRSCRLI